MSLLLVIIYQDLLVEEDTAYPFSAGSQGHMSTSNRDKNGADVGLGFYRIYPWWAQPKTLNHLTQLGLKK